MHEQKLNGISREIASSIRAARENISTQKTLQNTIQELKLAREEIAQARQEVKESSQTLGLVLLNLTEIMRELPRQTVKLSSAVETSTKQLNDCANSARTSLNLIEPELLNRMTLVERWATIIQNSTTYTVSELQQNTKEMKKRMSFYWILLCITVIASGMFGWWANNWLNIAKPDPQDVPEIIPTEKPIMPRKKK